MANRVSVEFMNDIIPDSLFGFVVGLIGDADITNKLSPEMALALSEEQVMGGGERVMLQLFLNPVARQLSSVTTIIPVIRKSK